MGVDYYPCSNCGETFPDCGTYHTCDQEHMLCSWCMRNKSSEQLQTDNDGWFKSEHCPTCAKGGSPDQRLAKIAALCDHKHIDGSEVNQFTLIEEIRTLSKERE